MCLNTQLRRKEAADCLRNVFGSTQQVWFDLLQDSVYSVALAPSGDIASVCVFVKVTEPDASTWGKITHLGTHGDYQSQGYAPAAMACALRYFREHTTHADFGLMADTYSSTPVSKRIQANRSAVTYYENRMGMAVSSALGAVSQVHEDGELTQQYMEGNIVAVLQKIGDTSIRTQVVDAFSYDAIRCKISEGGEREFQLHYTYETYGWTNISDVDVFSGLHIDGSGDIGGIDWATVEPALRKCGISRANVKDAMQKGKNQKVTLCAGARSPGQSSELQQRDIPEAYRQLDELETDDLCLVKAAAGGLHFCGRPNTAQKLLQTFPVGRVKMTMMTNFLQDKGVQAKKLPGRDRYGEDVLKTVMDAARAQKPNRYLAEIVDGNGLAGHAVFIDLQAGVIIDPANKTTVPFDQSQLDKCAGPYSMCWGLRHVRQLTISDGGGNKKRRRSRKKQDKKTSDRKKQSRCEKPPPEQMDIQLYAQSCVRADHPHDLQNFTEVFERNEYRRERYRGRNTLDFGTAVFKDTVVLCCGSFVGFFAMYALMHGAKKVICVEPLPSNFARLKENLARFGERVVLLQGAAVPSSQLSDHLFIEEKGYRSHIVTEEGEKTQAVVKNFTLSQLIGDHQCTYVKIDVEGLEADLLMDESVHWSSVTHLAFEYTRSSDKILGIEAALHTMGFSTDSWQACQFTPLAANNRDGVMFSTREPDLVRVLARLEQLPALPKIRDDMPHLRGIAYGFKALGGAGRINNEFTRSNPDLEKMLVALGNKILPDGFPFSSVLVLKNPECEVHPDKGNLGLSAVIKLGRFKEGGVWVCDNEGGKVLDCHNHVYTFDGKTPHASIPSKGECWSIVWYTRVEVPQAGSQLRKGLNDDGYCLVDANSTLREGEAPSTDVVEKAKQKFERFMTDREGDTSKECETNRRKKRRNTLHTV